MRVLICGNSQWPDAKPIFDVMHSYTQDSRTNVGLEFISGMAPGADAIAWYLARALGEDCDEYPWNEEGRAKIQAIMGPGYDERSRNQWMLDSGVDVCHAFAYDLRKSIGTRDMVNRCIEANVPCYWSNGTITREVLFEVQSDTGFNDEMEVVEWSPAILFAK